MSFSLSYNPVWSMVDLNGLQLDDNYYLFTLQNELPYLFSNIYQDQNGTIPWSNPIQFLANGTLPSNMYWNDAVTYRLEVRAGNSQSDALIYLVENYIPNNESVTPVTSSNNTDNQITNPQFATLNFAVPLVISTTSTTEIAPGWSIVTTGSGSLTLTQLLFAGNELIDTNPSYGLSIANSGFSTVTLRQRFSNNGALWSNAAVAASITMKADANNPTITTSLVYSGGTTPTQDILTPQITTGWNTYRGAVAIPASTNPDVPSVAYTDFDVSWVGNVTIGITSIQLVGQAVLSEDVLYEQITLERQTDHQYHVAYPIVPVGTIIDYFGFSIPLHYLLCDYAAYNRVTYQQLFNTLTKTETVTLTSTVATFTVANGSIYSIGYGVEGTGIPPSTTIIGISTNTITISSPASVTGSQSLRFFAAGNRFQETVTWASSTTFTVASGAAYKVGEAVTGTGISAATVITVIAANLITISIATAYVATNTSLVYFYDAGNGNETTTFNVPDTRRRGTIGSGGVVISATPLGIGNQLGNVGGEESHIQLSAEVGSHTHTATSGISLAAGAEGAGGGSRIYANGSSNVNPTIAANTPAGAAFNLYEPSLVTNKYIRYQ